MMAKNLNVFTDLSFFLEQMYNNNPLAKVPKTVSINA